MIRSKFYSDHCPSYHFKSITSFHFYITI